MGYAIAFTLISSLIIFVIFTIRKQNRETIEKRYPDIHTPSSENLLEVSILKAKKNIEKQISKSYLTSPSWMLFNSSDDFVLYTFKRNGELMITKNGNVKIVSYELLNDNQGIIIKSDKIEHFEIKLARNNLLQLLKLGNDDSLLFGNYTEFKDNSSEYIKSYLSKYV